MKQVFLKSGAIVVEDVPTPAPGPGEVLVHNAYSLISAGTETLALKGAQKSLVRRALERPDLVLKVIEKARTEGIRKTLARVTEKVQELKSLGYSSAGTVVAVGSDVIDINPGDLVACAGVGYASHAEFVTVPRNLVARVPEGVGLDEAAFTTLGAIAMHGIRRTECQLGETVVILGLGLLGLIAVQISKAAGHTVIGLDIDEARVNLARELGADHAFVIDASTVERIHDLTQGFGADAVVIYAATESSEPVNLAFDLCRRKGRVVGVGAFGMNFDREKMYSKELDFLMSTSYGPGRYDPLYEELGIDYPIAYVRWTENRNMQDFLRLVASGQVNVSRLITLTFPIEQAQEAYAALTTGDNRPLGVLFSYEQASKPSFVISVGPPRRKVSGKIGVAMVGAGSFAREVHLPNLTTLQDMFDVRWVVTKSGTSARQVAERFSIPNASTSLDDALGDPDVDLVVISTRHNLHASQTLAALAAGKAVFVEKPLCMNMEELEAIRSAVESTNLPVFVGFNRRYAPHVRYLRSVLERQGGPHIFLFRVNAGFIPRDHWVQDPVEGGGRLIGEGCHFVDTCNYLVGRNVGATRVHAYSVPVDGVRVVARDNFVIDISYADGSLASIAYVSAGSKELPKERLEVHSAGTSFVLDDFRELVAYGTTIQADGATGATWKLAAQDKGHRNELIEIARALRGEPSEAITFAEAYATMAITFEAAQRMATLEGGSEA